MASLAAVEAELDEVVVDLRWRVARLHETWAGTAAAAHLEAHGSWEASYREMHEALVAMRAAVRTAAANYVGRRVRQHVDVERGAVMLVDAAPLVDASSCFEHGNQSAALVHDTLLAAALGLRRDGGRRVDRGGVRGGVRRRRLRRASAAVGDLVDAFSTCGRLTAACWPTTATPRTARSSPAAPSSPALRAWPATSRSSPARSPRRWAATSPGCPPGRRGSSTRSRASSGRTPTPTGCARPPSAWRAALVPGRRPLVLLLLGRPLVLPAPLPRGPGRRRGHLRSWPTAAAPSATSAPSSARACDAYADHVDEQRAAILDLVHDLLRDAVIIEGIGIVLGAFTGGATAAGATALNAARIAAAAPRLLRIIETLRTLASTCAAPLRLAASALRDVRLELAVFRRARITVASAYDAERLARVERLRGLVNSHRLFDPQELRGLSRGRSSSRCARAGRCASDTTGSRGSCMTTRANNGRQIRVMDGYPPGTRPDPITWGPYAVVSQNGDTIKIPLEGNPTL